jgi:hypothetical protein
MPGGGFSPSDDFDETRPAGTDYGYDIDRWTTSNLQHTCNAYAIEHYEMSNDPDASEDDFGRHDFITLKQQSTKPNLTGSTNRTGFFTKSDGVYIEEADGTEIKILDFTSNRSGVDNDVPSGEIILFEKDTAVTGYTLQTDKDDMAVYITKGSGAGGESGGSDKTGGTWTISGLTADSHTHTSATHKHLLPFGYLSADNTFRIRTVPDGGSSAASKLTRGVGLSSELIKVPDWYYSNEATPGSTGTASTNGITSGGGWRLPGRNFTRQQRN